MLQETTRGVVFRRSAARVSWECPDIDRAFYVQVRYPHGERWETVAVSAHRGMAASLAGGMYRDTYKIVDQLRTLSTNREAEYYSDASVGVNPFSIRSGVLDITAAPGSNPLKMPDDTNRMDTSTNQCINAPI